MNRAIKFRAWDNVHERWLQIDGLSFKDGQATYYDGPDGTFPPEGNITLEQFTGLLDKNGKEIYEGDIVKQTTASGTDPHIRPVIFIQGTFGAGRPFNFYSMVIGTVEVVGNIHENPDLLK